MSSRPALLKIERAFKEVYEANETAKAKSVATEVLKTQLSFARQMVITWRQIEQDNYDKLDRLGYFDIQERGL